MICPPTSPVYGGLLCMLIISVSSGTVYVQSGSDITDCNMKCPQDDVTVELYRVCRGEDRRTLLENHCYINFTKSHDPRLRLHTGSGCWKLTSARKDDSCVYRIWCYDNTEYLMSSTEIRVLDPVLISNITSNGSRLGEEMAVSVQFSGEESAVTWEVDGEPLPERYRLIEDNRTLIIPSVQRDDVERRFWVRITNPVSEKIREYRLINDTMFIRMLETEDPGSVNGGVQFSLVAVLPVGLVMIYIVYQIYYRKKDLKSNGVYKDVPLAEERSVPPLQNQSIPTNGIPQDSPLAEVISVPIANGSIPTDGVPQDVPLAENRSVPPIQNESIPTNDVPQDVPPVKVISVPPIQNGSIPTNDVPQDVPLVESRSVPPIQNGFIHTDDVPLAEVRSVPPIQNESIPTNDVPQDMPPAEVISLPPIQNGSIPTNDVAQDVRLAEFRSVPPIQNGSIPTNKIGSPPATQNKFSFIGRNGGPPTPCTAAQINIFS